jgi:hypothetical protein
MNETISLVGEVEILLNNVVVVQKKNLIVQVGKNFLANAVLSNSTSPFVAIAVGSGTTAASANDTALQSELYRSTYTTSTLIANTITLTLTMLPGVATGSISEAGIFNNATSGGTMLSHVVFSTIGKQSIDTLVLTWTITVG